MLPTQLSADRFAAYPPKARALATSHLAILQQLPLAFAPLLLREVIAYDWRFPAERAELDHQFAFLSALSPASLQTEMAAFAQLQIPPSLEQTDWVNKPGDFSEQFTAHLWATHQIDAFRSASVDYVHKLNSSKPIEKLPIPRLVIGIIGQGVSENKSTLFRKLRPHGTYFNNLDPTNGRSILLRAAAARAARHPGDFAHWLVDGGSNLASETDSLTHVSYTSIEPVRLALVTQMRKVMQPGGGGPEKLRTMLAQMRPEDFGLSSTGNAAVLNRFQLSVLTEGSGTQLFSTTYVQWSARELLRRAQPLTLLAHFSPRVREASMKDLTAGNQSQPVPDPEGSLIDADMAAYYTWINLQRLPEADRSSFLVWFEDHPEALAVSPGLAPATENADRITMSELLQHLA